MRYKRLLLLFATAFVLGSVAVAMLLRAEALAEGYFCGPRPPAWCFAITVYQISGFLALCSVAVAVLSIPPVWRQFRSRVIAPVGARRPLSPVYLLLLYPLGLLTFALSYNVPLLGQVSEALEDGPLLLVFYPFHVIGAETVLSPLAHGFAPSDRYEPSYWWGGDPHLAWLFFVALAAFTCLAARVGFWFAGSGGTSGSSNRESPRTHNTRVQTDAAVNEEGDAHGME